MTQFQPQDTIKWFEDHGVPLKTESDNRIFPVSDSSQSIFDCLTSTARELGVSLWTECSVSKVTHSNSTFILHLADGQEIEAQNVILATGSNRSGYNLATQLGHQIVAPIPSLFTFKIHDKDLHSLQGLSVTDAEVWLDGYKKTSRRGPVLITHWGLSGPAVITQSAWFARELNERAYNFPVYVNWLGSYSTDDVSSIIDENISYYPKKGVSSLSPFSQLPKRLWAYLVDQSGIPESHTWHQLSKHQRLRLASILTQQRFQMNGKTTFKEEFVTCGGVDLKEINFKSMESKLVPGLYIVGELLNIDGVTGGFNFQNAWTTGYLAGSAS
jgi:hypothetical protein